MKRLIPLILIALAIVFGLWYVWNNRDVGESDVPVETVTTVPISRPLPVRYDDTEDRFSIRLPEGFGIDTTHQYQLNPERTISGVRFTIPAAAAEGTNLSTDSYLSVEFFPDVSVCDAAQFLDGTHTALLRTDGSITYSVAEASNAGAGNRYDETVYVIPDNEPCVAIRYMIHSTAIQNYDPGTRQEFNHSDLIGIFDDIRRSLILR